MIKIAKLLRQNRIPLIAVQITAAERGGVDYSTALRLAAAGDLPATRTRDGGWWIARADLQACIAALIAVRGAGPGTA